MLKVVLINAISPYLDIIDYHEKPIPYGLGYLVASVQHDIPEIDISIADDIDELIACGPDVAGISAMTDNYAVAIEWGRKIKSALNIPIVIGGPHITLAPESIHRCFDVAVVGEGEITFVELLKSIIQYNVIDYADLAHIPGLFFRDRETSVLTPKRPTIKNLDSIPFPGNKILPVTSTGYRPYIFSARGCPFQCSFCAAKEIFQGYRSHSVDYVVRQIKDLVLNDNVDHIYFADDLFFADKKKLEELIQKLKMEKLLGKCSYSCWARANLVTEEVCHLLKKLNVTNVGLGVESFSDNVLKGLNKSGVTSKINQKAIDLLTANDITLNITLIYATPYEDQTEMIDTYKAMFLNLKSKNIIRIDSGPLRPYPGTKVWRDAEEKGLVSENMDWDIFLNPISYAGDVIEELYLGEKIAIDICRKIQNEWKTKYSLLSNRLNKQVQGTMFIKDAAMLAENLVFLNEEIEERNQNQSVEAGDELILGFTNPVLISGCWPEDGEEWFWMSKNMNLILKPDHSRSILFEFMALDFFSELDMFPMTLSVRCRDHLIASHLIEKPGIVKISSDELSVPETSFYDLCFVVDKSFIPSKSNRGADSRELSLFVKISYQ